MRSLLVILSYSLSILTTQAWVEPWFCHGINCPIYEDVQNMTVDGQIIEIRKYEAALWTSTLIKNTNLETAEQIGFQRDFDYIAGNNSANDNIDMTSPVLNYIQPG